MAVSVSSEGESSESAKVDSDWLSVFHQRGESSESANDIVLLHHWYSRGVNAAILLNLE